MVLRVSRTIHQAVEDVYLSRSIFVLRRFWYKQQPIHPDDRENHLAYRFSGAALDKVKHISISLDAYVSRRPGFYHSTWTDRAVKPLCSITALQQKAPNGPRTCSRLALEGARHVVGSHCTRLPILGELSATSVQYLGPVSHKYHYSNSTSQPQSQVN